MPRYSRSSLLIFLFLLGWGWYSSGSVLGDQKLPPLIEKYLQSHCLKCHSAGSEVSEFRIDTLSPQLGIEDTPQWREIMGRVTAGEMPPEDHPHRPSVDESDEFVQLLSSQLKAGESIRMAARGRVTYNRLTREEYVNTVRDLIGVQFDAADPGGFLEEPEWKGFERLGSVLTTAPSNIEKYLSAAETILAEAYPEKKPQFLQYTKPALMENQISTKHRERLRELGLLDKVRFEMWAGDIYRYSASESLPAPGIYEISYTLSGLKPENGLAPRLFVYETRLDRVLYQQDVIAPEDAPITVSFLAHLPQGRPSIHVINEIPGPSNNPRSGRHGGKPFISIKDGRIPWQMKLTDEEGNPRYPFLILDSVSFRGPIITDQEQQRRNEYFPPDAKTINEIREGLGQMAFRAFRRPVSSEELDQYLSIVQIELDAGETFSNAVKTGMLAILCSKSFLFLAEGSEDADRQTLNDWEIASRLSYLLWSTMPDEELFQLAEQGRLQDKTERAQQVARMLADPRARRFSDSFTSQWLNLRKIGQFPPDKKLYPEYDPHLELSLVQEPQEFFNEVLTQGLTLREFLDSSWTMLNARLAKYYGLSDEGLVDEFQRVELPEDSHRGGLLTQAGILSMTSDGTRHRPVHRGVWVSEAIFGKTPPPPPANIDPIEPTPLDAPKATLRMKLEAHILNPRCAACHQQMDPFGLAFENYDAIGRWRTVEVTEGTGPNPMVDPSGKFADGRAYHNVEEFKQILLNDIDKFNSTFVEKLATYGMRRVVALNDQEELDAIAAVGRSKDYRVRDIIEAFVTSDLFVKR